MPASRTTTCFPLALPAVLLLAGCQAPTDHPQTEGELMQASVASWKYHHRDEVEAMIGPPTSSRGENKENQATYYFVDGRFAQPVDAALYDPGDPATYQCKVTVTYSGNIVMDVVAEGSDCVMNP